MCLDGGWRWAVIHIRKYTRAFLTNQSNGPHIKVTYNPNPNQPTHIARTPPPPQKNSAVSFKGVDDRGHGKEDEALEVMEREPRGDGVESRTTKVRFSLELLSLMFYLLRYNR